MATEKADKAIAEVQGIIAPAQSAPKGSDLSDMIDKMIAWVKTFDIGDWDWDNVHKMLHFAIDNVLPLAKIVAPDKIDEIIDKVISPLLKKIDDWLFDHPEPVPPTPPTP